MLRFAVDVDEAQLSCNLTGIYCYIGEAVSHKKLEARKLFVRSGLSCENGDKV